MKSILAYVIAAIAEIAGCFSVWAWLRLGQSAWWVVPGMLSLALFAFTLTLVQLDAAGRAYAAYGGIYIAASLAWLWTVEGLRPDRWARTRRSRRLRRPISCGRWPNTSGSSGEAGDDDRP